MNPDQINLTERTLIRRYGKDKTYRVMHSDIPPRDLVRSLAAESFQYFCQFFLSEYFNVPYGPMHDELANDVDEALKSKSGWKELLIWPKGFGKTSHICTGLGVYACALRKRPYMIIIKNSYESQAQPEVMAIRDELESNDLLIQYWGSFKSKRSWGKGEFITLGKWPEGGIKIQALGVGMKIRGSKHGPYRPGIIVMDDLENLESVESRVQRDKTRNWHDRSAMTAGLEPGEEDRCLYFDIGTNLHTDCLVANLLKRPMWRHRFWRAELAPAQNQMIWDEWKAVVCDLSNENRLAAGRAFFDARKDEMLKGSKVSWPEGYDYYRLALVRLGEQKVGESKVVSFEAEMQNNPISASSRVFKVRHYYHMEDREGEIWLVPDSWGKAVKYRDCDIYGACDPSLGEGDYSAIILMARSPYGQKFVIVADLKRRDPDRIIDDVLSYCRGREVEAFAIESNAFQKLLYTVAVKAAMEAQDYVPFIPIPAKGKKSLRICGLAPDLANGYILLNREHQLLNEQIEDYALRGVAYDDGPDCLALCDQVSRMHTGGSLMF
ncbi:MAG: phage terminase large subunit [Chloroflexi bacterium]|nr:phage terminase large subunit [Chloroflexota bacterium]